ncbi:Hydrogenase-4 component B [Roseivivax jejudonensis]|uniref:Hydrogenase-4 component B n=1 Tax=Roseivivax jejudonensis TaxID=1529041 RepID=A0A1X6Y6P8_9RHOB|nr:proton-conducting transporter membrane subunit [Roseivivax jejudonensis]SLN12308.1 Hydrogenase-4 component B [Roseivivax jejudonensis]
MIAVPIWLVPAVPLALLVAFCVPVLRPGVRSLVPIAPLAGLLAALADPVPAPARIDWLMLGTEFAMTDLGRPFVAFTAALWSLAGWQALRLLRDDPARDRFFACMLMAMAGNLGLLVAQDIASFYAFFAAMSLSSWGLVLHGMGAAQRFAGRVYIGFAIAGEVVLFAGLSLASFATGDTRLAATAGPEVPALATALMAAGLLVKLGAVPLHLWLPLAHAAAPAPASAVLSGAMLKAGLFGLMTILPLGTEAEPGAAATLAAIALAGLILAPCLGLLHGDPKAVLAYSSVGQMSLMALGLAAALAAPAAWPAIAPALVLLAAHHAFAKAALFLGVPTIWATARGPARSAVLVLLALPALALAGMPATSGATAKAALKTGLDGAADGWLVWLEPALFAASLGTALLMIRALILLAGAAPKPDVAADVSLPWLAMSGLVVAGPWLVPDPPVTDAAAGLSDLAPIVVAVALAVGVAVVLRGARLSVATMPPGEVLSLVARRPEPEPVLALSAPVRRGHALVVRRSRPLTPRPERGALAILFVAAALAFAMAVTGPETTHEPETPMSDTL